ncbi:hypothetical protein HY464_02125, partial [Candidatus Peregrinibacteria bacterium]|nr:hypothetical protein [Candidatus Peregrinibacteria bacterium]
MPKNTRTSYAAFAAKCVLAGVACAFLIFLIRKYGASETLANAFLIDKTYAADVSCGWTRPLGCLLWFVIKIIMVAIAFMVIVSKLIMWILYQVVVIITSLLLVYIGIPLIEHTLSPSEGTIAWNLFFRPEVQNAIHDNLWIVSRDIVNILLALLLLVGAILTIIKANKEFLSQYAPKFLMVLILVNFSWFIPRVIIDVSTVFTKTVTGIAGPCIPSPSRSCRTITGISITGGSGENCPTVLTCMQYGQIQGNGAARVMGGLTSLYGEILMKGARFASMPNFIQVMFIDPIQKAISDDSGLVALLASIMEFYLTLGIVAISAILFTVAIVTLALIFLVRILILWLTMGFMPFAMLGFVVPSLRGWTTEKIWNPFLAAAFVPVLACVPLTAGYILLNAVPLLPTPLPGSSAQFMAIFADLIPTVMAIGVIWLGVFAAIGAFKFAGSLQEGITGRMKTIGQGAAMATGVMFASKVPIPNPDKAAGLAIGGATAIAGWLLQLGGNKKGAGPGAGGTPLKPGSPPPTKPTGPGGGAPAGEKPKKPPTLETMKALTGRTLDMDGVRSRVDGVGKDKEGKDVVHLTGKDGTKYEAPMKSLAGAKVLKEGANGEIARETAAPTPSPTGSGALAGGAPAEGGAPKEGIGEEVRKGARKGVIEGMGGKAAEEKETPKSATEGEGAPPATEGMGWRQKLGKQLQEQGGKVMQRGAVGHVATTGKEWWNQFQETDTGKRTSAIAGGTRKFIGNLFSGSALQKGLVGFAMKAGTGQLDSVLSDYAKGGGQRSLKDLLGARLKPQGISGEEAKKAATKLGDDSSGKGQRFLDAAKALEQATTAV